MVLDGWYQAGWLEEENAKSRSNGGPQKMGTDGSHMSWCHAQDGEYGLHEPLLFGGDCERGTQVKRWSPCRKGKEAAVFVMVYIVWQISSWSLNPGPQRTWGHSGAVDDLSQCCSGVLPFHTAVLFLVLKPQTASLSSLSAHLSTQHP